MKIPSLVVFSALALVGPLFAQAPPGEGPAMGGNRMHQSDVVGGNYTLDELRAHGQMIFSTPFNKLDGYGDGPINPLDTTSPGGRPTLQGNGTFLRVNGLDAQTCIECHSVGSNAIAPFRFGIGGVGGSNSNAIGGPRNIDVDDEVGAGFASFDGRYINPPFLFGSGGVELAGKEMTQDLQRAKHLAASMPDVSVPLITHGVSFGSLTWSTALGGLDTSQVVGVSDDLVVRPFGRKGEFATVRDFDVAAMEFHLGMQPVEVVGHGNDGDGDGVVDEVFAGELSVLHLFNVTLKAPVTDAPSPESLAGEALFQSIGCVECHVPTLETRKQLLPLTFPEVHNKPFNNGYMNVSLFGGNAGFQPNGVGGVSVPLFSDLKRHDMGPVLAESTGHALAAQFVTARLWGVADTSPYMHDGRATTLTEAILLHGGEGQTARNNFDVLSDTEKIAVLTFLRTLRTPLDPTGGL
ncbi:MAG: hypothetical protein ACI9F9_002682 [Candidatus Paceibacteria bacterium]|jgi:hypothetical protein